MNRGEKVASFRCSTNTASENDRFHIEMQEDFDQSCNTENAAAKKRPNIDDMNDDDDHLKNGKFSHYNNVRSIFDVNTAEIESDLSNDDDDDDEEEKDNTIVDDDIERGKLSAQLRALGVTRFRSSTYEKGVIDQLERSIIGSTIISESEDGSFEPISNEPNLDDEESRVQKCDIDTDVDQCAKPMQNANIDYDENDEDDDDDDEYRSKFHNLSETIANCIDDDDVDRYIIGAAENCDDPRFAKRSKRSKDTLKEVDHSPRATIKTVTIDDGDRKRFKRRVAEYRLFCAQNQLDHHHQRDNELIAIDPDRDPEWRIPARIWDQLFQHQRESLRWLAHLHRRQCGGIIGDEMGLGKTIQIIAFLVTLAHSRIREPGERYRALGPVLIVSPATVMMQWVREFHRWWPPFRVALLHQSGSFRGGDDDRDGSDKLKLAREIATQSGGILITSYLTLAKHSQMLSEFEWHYLILDEGHKIRNPDANWTLAVKQIKTVHRIILSGSPIQNNLKELWSLFDFVYPGKLGTLRTFTESVARPIRVGGFHHATDLQKQIAYRITVKLRDAIRPYLLRRTKSDVRSALRLPAKSEKVLFCRLTERQRELYRSYVESGVVRDINRGQTMVFAALTNIRKICNHPHLFRPQPEYRRALNHDDDDDDDEDHNDNLRNFFAQSGKLMVVRALLRCWRKHRRQVLLFAQTRQMLNIIERFIRWRRYTYLRMDGRTSLKERARRIADFNSNPDRFVFLLTTRVGGLGLNLTAASRVILFDPDWNPCTDIQARERCYRIGQNRDVMIFRLIASGSVEEKIYHRQIYKQYLTNSVLHNPAYRRFFKLNDLRELFSLADHSESGDYFADAKCRELKRDNRKRKSISKLSTQTATKGMLCNSADFATLPKIRKVSKKADAGDNDDQAEEVRSNFALSDAKRREMISRVRAISKMIEESKVKTGGKISRCIDASKSDYHQESKKESQNNNTNNNNNNNPKSGTKIDGIEIKNLDSIEDYNDDDDAEEEEEDYDYSGEKDTREKMSLISSDRKRRSKKSKKKSKRKNRKEDYILRQLLGDSMIDLMLEHDRVESARIPDHFYLEREAETIAREAIEKLKIENVEIFARNRNNPNDPEEEEEEEEEEVEEEEDIGTLNRNTFTIIRNIEPPIASSSSSTISNNNTNNKPIIATTSSSSSSSSSILQQMRLRNKINVTTDQSSRNESNCLISSTVRRESTERKSSQPTNRNVSKSNGKKMLDNDELMRELFRFFLGQVTTDGRPAAIPSQIIIDRFAGRVAPERATIFKAFIKKLADKRRRADGRIEWRLKAKFRAGISGATG